MANLIVTEKNVKMISTPDLLKRYGKLNRSLSKMSMIDHPDILTECKSELELVKKALVRRGHKKEIFEQMSIPDLIPKKEEYEHIVISKLRNHAFNKIQLASLKFRLQQGFELVFPSNISSVYQSDLQGGQQAYQSKSERAVLEKEEKKENIAYEIALLEYEVELVEKFLEVLDPLEKVLIQQKYLQKAEKKDEFIISMMPVSRSKFYELRNSALSKLAEAFRII